MQSGGRGGFNVTISAVDQLSKPIADMGRVLGQFSRELKDFERSSEGPVGARGGFFQRAEQFATRGARAFSRGLREVGTEARELGRGLTEAFEPVAKLAGIGGGIAAGVGLAALAETIERTARAGAGFGHTAERIGITAQALQELSGAASLAGVGADALASGVETLGQKLSVAALGQDSQAMAFFRQFNIAVRNSDGSIRSAASALGDVAEAISKIPNRTIQARAAVLAFGDAGREMLPFLREGRAGIAQYNEEVRRYGFVLGKEGVEASHEFEKAQARVHLALGGVANRITEELLPVINPMITGMAQWIAKNREWITQGVAEHVTEFANAMKSADWKAIGEGIKLIGESIGLVATGITKSLEGYGKLVEIYKEAQGLLGAEKNMPQVGPGFEEEPRSGMGVLWDYLTGRDKTFGQPRYRRRTGSVGPPDLTGMGEGHVASEAERGAFIREYTASKGLNPDAILGTAGREGLHKFAGDYDSRGQPTSFGDFQLHVGGGMGDLAARAGIRVADPNDWKRADMFAIDQMAAHRGNAAWYASQWHGATPEQALAFSQGAPSVASRIGNWLRTPLNRGGFSVPPGTPFSTSGPNAGKPYSTGLALMTPEQKANEAASMAWIKANQGGTWGTLPADTSGLRRGGALDLEKLKGAGSRDSQTSIDVNFNDAPSGMRTRVSDSDGPAKISLRTQYAFGGI